MRVGLAAPQAARGARRLLDPGAPEPAGPTSAEAHAKCHADGAWGSDGAKGPLDDVKRWVVPGLALLLSPRDVMLLGLHPCLWFLRCVRRAARWAPTPQMRATSWEDVAREKCRGKCHHGSTQSSAADAAKMSGNDPHPPQQAWRARRGRALSGAATCPCRWAPIAASLLRARPCKCDARPQLVRCSSAEVRVAGSTHTHASAAFARGLAAARFA